MGAIAGPSGFNHLTLTINMTEGVFGCSAENALKGGRGVEDARVPKAVIERKGIKSKPELGVPNHVFFFFCNKSFIIIESNAQIYPEPNGQCKQ